MIWKIILKNHDNLLILVILSFLTFYFLIENKFFGNSNEEIFLFFCFEIVHFLIIGSPINKKTVKDILLKKMKFNFLEKKKNEKNLENSKILKNSKIDSISILKLFLKKNEKKEILEKVINNRLSFEKSIKRFEEKISNYKIKKNKILLKKKLIFEKIKNEKFFLSKKNSKYKIDLNKTSIALISNTLNKKKKREIYLLNSFRQKNNFHILKKKNFEKKKKKIFHKKNKLSLNLKNNRLGINFEEKYKHFREIDHGVKILENKLNKLLLPQKKNFVINSKNQGGTLDLKEMDKVLEKYENFFPEKILVKKNKSFVKKKIFVKNSFFFKRGKENKKIFCDKKNFSMEKKIKIKSERVEFKKKEKGYKNNYWKYKYMADKVIKKFIFK